MLDLDETSPVYGVDTITFIGDFVLRGVSSIVRLELAVQRRLHGIPSEVSSPVWGVSLFLESRLVTPVVRSQLTPKSFTVNKVVSS